MPLYKKEPADLLYYRHSHAGAGGSGTIREFRRNIPHPWPKNHCYSGGGNSSSLDYLRTAKFVGADRTLANLSPREEILEAAGELLQS